MIGEFDIRAALDKMILSASGWRGIFAGDGDEQSTSGEVCEAHQIIAAAAACCFAGFVQSTRKNAAQPLVLAGSDTRPTGKIIARAVIAGLLSAGAEVKWAGFAAIPEIMAWAGSHVSSSGGAADRAVGFIYISASHNPIGHNGLKFGLADGGVLAPEKNAALISQFKSYIADSGSAAHILQLISGISPGLLQAVYAREAESKKEALIAYHNFSDEVAWSAHSRSMRTIAPNGPAAGQKTPVAAVRSGLARQPVGIVCDFNGSARCASIDRDFISGLGMDFRAMNDKPGQITHAIIPEGTSLEPCRKFLEETHSADPSFVLGYTPDCDGDRGNLVAWDETIAQARILEAQEVFALACVAELAVMAWEREHACDDRAPARTALVVNDPTSLRIERIAAAFNVPVFRAEVGEANVVGRARKLREQGCSVRILGEGSNGGCIIHPSAVRDPLNTVISLVKLLAIKSEDNRPGPFELWCNLSNQGRLYNKDFGIRDIIASLPPFVTTAVSDKIAILGIQTKDHGVLKDRYGQIFLSDWEKKKNEFKSRYGICAWEAIAYNGMEERRNPEKFGGAGKGGLKICFKNEEGIATSSIWMRGSATEPVFRIMADAEGHDIRMERELIEWQRRMVLEADAWGG